MAGSARRSRNCTDFFCHKQKNFAVPSKVFCVSSSLLRRASSS